MNKDWFKEDRFDFFLLGIVIVLLCLGLVMVYSASHHLAERRLQDGSIFFRMHFYRVALGLAVFLIAAFIPYRFWLKTARIWILLGLGLLIAVLTLGVAEGHAQRWLRIGSMRFQPVDFVRLAVIFYLCDTMIRKKEMIDKFGSFLLPQLIILSIIAFLLIKQPDMGSVVIIFLISAVIFITAGVNFSQLAFLGMALLPVLLLTKSYHIARIRDFLNSLLHGEPLTYQINQSLISLGSGGIFGKGLDNSTQKLSFLPEPFTDFIFAIVGEEFGFAGTTLVLTLFLLLILAGFRIARNCQEDGGVLLATAITSSIALYAFLNAGVVSNLLPTKGLPMPFVSYGGSFTLTTMAGIGILFNISQNGEFNTVMARSKKRRRIG